jgi:hypothetical protein
MWDTCIIITNHISEIERFKIQDVMQNELMLYFSILLLLTKLYSELNKYWCISEVKKLVHFTKTKFIGHNTFPVMYK